MSKHTLPLDNFLWDECHCKDVEVQTYTNTVSMKAPHIERNDGWVCIDTCIATEIGYLWQNGIRTINSCCGHNIEGFHSWVIVEKTDDEKMKKMGYQSYVAQSGRNCHLLKTGFSTTLNELKEKVINE